MLGQDTAPARVGALGGRVPRRHLVAAPAGLITALLSVLVVGVPATLLMAGAWSLAFAASRIRYGLRGAAGWAAGIVAEVALVSTLDFGKALLSGHERGQTAHLLVLLAPVVLGLVVGVLAPRRWPVVVDPEEPPRPSHAWLPLVVTLGGLLVFAWISSRGSGYDVAWALSGDGRNHLLLMRGILHKGGITLTQLRAYPALTNALSADVSGAGGRAGLAPGALMLHDARALSETYVVSAIALSVMFVAALLESLPRPPVLARRLTPAVVGVVLVASVTTVSSFVLGTSLLDGFFSTYAALPVAVAAVVLAMRHMAAPTGWALGLLGAATVFVLFAWTILVVVPVAATAVALCAQGRRLPRRPWWLLGAAIALGSVAVVLGVLVTQYGKLRSQFLTPGPPPTPLQHWVLYLLSLVILAVVASSRGREALRQRAVLVAVAVLGLVTIYWLRQITPDGHTWTYYAAKSLWAISSSLLWVAFLPLALAATSPTVSRLRWPQVAGAVQAVAGSLAVVVVVGLLTKVGDPVHEAARGWTQPSAKVITEVATYGDKRVPFVLWGFSYPGDERLGEFAAELTWGSAPDGSPLPLPGYPQGFFQWGYQDDLTFRSLCLLARSVRGLTVVTHETALVRQMRASCPGSGAHVVVVPPAKS